MFNTNIVQNAVRDSVEVLNSACKEKGLDKQYDFILEIRSRETLKEVEDDSKPKTELDYYGVLIFGVLEDNTRCILYDDYFGFVNKQHSKRDKTWQNKLCTKFFYECLATFAFTAKTLQKQLDKQIAEEAANGTTTVVE